MELTVSESGRVELVLTSAKAYELPLRQVRVRGEIRGPDGREQEREAFWDGGRTWRLRFSTPVGGTWTVATRTGDGADEGLHGRKAQLQVGAPPQPAHPLARHGALRLAESRRHLVHADGTPFFWLADTAWNGVLKAQDADWQRYLSLRRQQGFTVIQAVLSHWRAFPEDQRGEKAFAGEERMRVNPAFYQRLDHRVEAIADHGLVPALVLLWAYGEDDPGQRLPVEEAVLLARYQVARYGHLPAVWLLGGDGTYGGEHAARWQRIGRGVFGDGSRDHGLVTLHPRGQRWVGDTFRSEPWYDLIAYQSSHGRTDEALRWLVQGPPACRWGAEPALPVINQEPCYEAIAYGKDEPLDVYPVRRALYWSLLNAPTAGVSYGHHGVWPWQELHGVPPGHKTCAAPPWHEGVHAPGARTVLHLKHFFASLQWWRLEPAADLLVRQPGHGDVRRFITAARSPAGDLAVCYLPCGGPVALNTRQLQPGGAIAWFDPRSGDWLPLGTLATTGELDLTAPSQEDWLLCIGHGTAS